MTGFETYCALALLFYVAVALSGAKYVQKKYESDADKMKGCVYLAVFSTVFIWAVGYLLFV